MKSGRKTLKLWAVVIILDQKGWSLAGTWPEQKIDTKSVRIIRPQLPRVHFMHLGLKIFGVDLTFLLA